MKCPSLKIETNVGQVMTERDGDFNCLVILARVGQCVKRLSHSQLKKFREWGTRLAHLLHIII